MRDRLLPDKAIDVMDETGAAVRPTAGALPDAPKAGETRPAVSMADVERVVARMAVSPLRTVSGGNARAWRILERDRSIWSSARTKQIELTVRAILRARAGLGQGERLAVFVLMGPRAWAKPRWPAVLPSSWVWSFCVTT